MKLVFHMKLIIKAKTVSDTVRIRHMQWGKIYDNNKTWEKGKCCFDVHYNTVAWDICNCFSCLSSLLLMYVITEQLLQLYIIQKVLIVKHKFQHNVFRVQHVNNIAFRRYIVRINSKMASDGIWKLLNAKCFNPKPAEFLK